MPMTLEQTGMNVITSRSAFILRFISTIALWTIAGGFPTAATFFLTDRQHFDKTLREGICLGDRGRFFESFYVCGSAPAFGVA
jgi:hypothetical protein